MSYEIAAPTHYLVLEKQRRDPQITSPPLHQADQVRHARLPVEAFTSMFTADEVVRDDEIIPVGRYWKHGERNR